MNEPTDLRHATIQSGSHCHIIHLQQNWKHCQVVSSHILGTFLSVLS